ncbi:MAG: hypothetical protein CSA24_02505 [Deltaproteobacteria bacterium]|nr:MAG: hypothetical protein CSA24_02505 [Deltaproteobacteria bacterium]
MDQGFIAALASPAGGVSQPSLQRRSPIGSESLRDDGVILAVEVPDPAEGAPRGLGKGERYQQDGREPRPRGFD